MNEETKTESVPQDYVAMWKNRLDRYLDMRSSLNITDGDPFNQFFIKSHRHAIALGQLGGYPLKSIEERMMRSQTRYVGTYNSSVMGSIP